MGFAASVKKINDKQAEREKKAAAAKAASKKPSAKAVAKPKKSKDS